MTRLQQINHTFAQAIEQINRTAYLIETTRSESRKNVLRRKIEELEYQAYLKARTA